MDLKEKLYRMPIPEDWWDRVYQVTIAIRGGDQPPGGLKPPSRYMPHFSAAAKGIYLMSQALAECAPTKTMDADYWYNRFFKIALIGKGKFPVDHYMDFMKAVGKWWNKYGEQIGERRFLLNTPPFIQWWYRKRIKKLYELQVKWYGELEHLTREYNIYQHFKGEHNEPTTQQTHSEDS